MRKIGKIIRLQIQPASLKSGQRPYQIYSPANLLSLATIRLTPQGVVGLLPDGTEQVDVHHAAHPHSANRQNNGVSVNFTSHYGRIRQRFGSHFMDGCAGENILVETDENFSVDDLANGVMIVGKNGRATPLTQILVAAPCEPFSRYLLEMASRAPADLMKQTLQFLDNGTRGYYASFDNSHSTVNVGDSLHIIE